MICEFFCMRHARTADREDAEIRKTMEIENKIIKGEKNNKKSKLYLNGWLFKIEKVGSFT